MKEDLKTVLFIEVVAALEAYQAATAARFPSPKPSGDRNALQPCGRSWRRPGRKTSLKPERRADGACHLPSQMLPAAITVLLVFPFKGRVTPRAEEVAQRVIFFDWQGDPVTYRTEHTSADLPPVQSDLALRHI